MTLPLAAFRRIVKDYFMICDSYFQAIKGATPVAHRGDRHGPARPAQRGIRDPSRGAGGKVEIDHDTARRLFTLVCVLHIRG